MTAPMSINILDAMILVGATAFGFGVLYPFVPTITRDMVHARSLREVFQVAMIAAWPCVVAWTLAVLILRLRLRPYLLDLLRRPGDLACGTAIVALIACILPF